MFEKNQPTNNFFTLSSCYLEGEEASAHPELKSSLKSENLRFFSAKRNKKIGLGSVQGLRQYSEKELRILDEEFDFLVPARQMKWRQIHPQMNVWDFSRMDSLV